jgi:hypothetical protein
MTTPNPATTAWVPLWDLNGGGGITVPAGAEDGDVLYVTAGAVAAAPLWTLGYWAPVTNGDPVSPELLFDSMGEAIVGFTPTA